MGSPKRSRRPHSAPHPNHPRHKTTESLSKTPNNRRRNTLAMQGQITSLGKLHKIGGSGRMATQEFEQSVLARSSADARQPSRAATRRPALIQRRKRTTRMFGPRPRCPLPSRPDLAPACLPLNHSPLPLKTCDPTCCVTDPTKGGSAQIV